MLVNILHLVECVLCNGWYGVLLNYSKIDDVSHAFVANVNMCDVITILKPFIEKY